MCHMLSRHITALSASGFSLSIMVIGLINPVNNPEVDKDWRGLLMESNCHKAGCHPVTLAQDVHPYDHCSHMKSCL